MSRLELPLGLVGGLIITLTSYALGRWLGRRWPAIPSIVWSAGLLIGVLSFLPWPYVQYYQLLEPLFSHLLGYATVALAIPLATSRWQDLPGRRLMGLVSLASVMGALLPTGLASVMGLATDQRLAFVTRSVTTPIALSLSAIVHSPPLLVAFIVIVSGLMGAALSPLLLRRITDERAAGLALGLAAHALGTAQAWQRSPLAGRYAALGMATNGLLTALWVPLVF